MSFHTRGFALRRIAFAGLLAFAVFATEAFLRPALGDSMALNVGPYRDGWTLRAAFAF